MILYVFNTNIFNGKLEKQSIYKVHKIGLRLLPTILLNFSNTVASQLLFSLHYSTHIFFSCFLKVLPYYFVFLLTVNKQVIFFRLLTYPLRVSSAMECLKVTLSEALYYLSYSVETETEMFMNRSFVLINKI